MKKDEFKQLKILGFLYFDALYFSKEFAHFYPLGKDFLCTLEILKVFNHLSLESGKILVLVPGSQLYRELASPLIYL